ncbi:MAG: leucine-rich repeat domain-containing protein [Candidatus Omnitrophica bacterium]|nr:leucine-rich repeat domain-containing protein [Candidatus Omnitrophota bacterium]
MICSPSPISRLLRIIGLALLAFPSCAQTVVNFPDPNLEQAVRVRITKPTGDILTTDLVGVGFTSLAVGGVSDLTGLEYCTDLTTLSLYDTTGGTTDLSPLFSLSQLTALSLNSMGVTDIGALAGLINMATLSIWMNQVVDISPLSGLVNLRFLNLEQNNIVDISPLADLSQLTDLNLEWNQIIDISPLAGLTNLRGLLLSKNRITDLQALVENAGLSSGDVVYLLWNNLFCSAVNQQIPLLQSRGVNVYGDAVPGCIPTVVLFPDAHLEQAVREAIGKPSGDILNTDVIGAGFTTLDATNRGIVHLSGLEHCRDLIELDLSGNNLSDPEDQLGTGRWRDNYFILADMINLRTLDISSNDIPWIGFDFIPLSGLRANNNRIRDISTFFWIPGEVLNPTLKELGLASNLIEDFSPLTDLPNLTSLDVSDNEITDITWVASLTHLTRLDLGPNQITNIAPLSNLTGLTWLDLGPNRISDFSPLAGLANLNWLDLEGNQIADIQFLTTHLGIGAGDEVSLLNNPLSCDALDQEVPILEGRGVTVHSSTSSCTPESIEVGSDGADGVLNVTESLVIDLSLAATASWDEVTPPSSGNGLYSPERWAVVFRYSSVNIAPGASVSFNNHPSGAPVVWLVAGDVIINGTVSVAGLENTPGPGGFRGGEGYHFFLTFWSKAGRGPGGGGPNHRAAFGGVYGNEQIVPLIGGSGGDGVPPSGDPFQEQHTYSGGGGGALLIASESLIVVNGAIDVEGGVGPESGSGGAIRLVADSISGSGQLHVPGGERSAGAGRVRIEAHSSSLAGMGELVGRSTGSSDSWVSLQAPANPATIFPGDAGPRIDAVSLGGQAVPSDPRPDEELLADLVFTSSGTKTLVLSTRNIDPISSSVRVRAVEFDEQVISATHVAGNVNASTWEAEVDLGPAYPWNRRLVIQALAIRGVGGAFASREFSVDVVEATLTPTPSVTDTPAATETPTQTPTPTDTLPPTPLPFLLAVSANEQFPLPIGYSIFDFDFSVDMAADENPVLEAVHDSPEAASLTFSASPGWISSTRWKGVTVVTPQTPDGPYRIRVTRAETSEGFVITGDTVHHLRINKELVDTTGEVLYSTTSSLLIKWDFPIVPDRGTTTSFLGSRVFRSTSMEGPFESIAFVPWPKANYLDEGLSEDTTYYYHVVVINLLHEEVSRTQAFEGATVRQLLNFRLEVLSSTEIRLHWTGSNTEEILGYRIERALSRGGLYEMWTEVTVGPLESYQITDAALTPASTYCYRVIEVSDDLNETLLGPQCGQTLEIEPVLSLSPESLLRLLQSIRNRTALNSDLVESAMHWAKQ